MDEDLKVFVRAAKLNLTDREAKILSRTIRHLKDSGSWERMDKLFFFNGWVPAVLMAADQFNDENHIQLEPDQAPPEGTV